MVTRESFGKFKVLTDISDFVAHRRFSNNVKKHLAASKKVYEEFVISSGNSKQFFKYIRSSLYS